MAEDAWLSFGAGTHHTSIAGRTTSRAPPRLTSRRAATPPAHWLAAHCVRTSKRVGIPSDERKEAWEQEAHHRRARCNEGDAEGRRRRGGRAREDRRDVRLRPCDGRAGARD